MLALPSPTNGGHSVGVVHSQTQTTEFIFFLFNYTITGAAIEISSLKGTQQNNRRTETDPVSETLRSLVFRIPDIGQSSETLRF
jgi:hypothetical protein